MGKAVVMSIYLTDRTLIYTSPNGCAACGITYYFKLDKIKIYGCSPFDHILEENGSGNFAECVFIDYCYNGYYLWDPV